MKFTKKSEELKTYLYSDDSDPHVCSYIMIATAMAPKAGERFLQDEIRMLNWEFRQYAKQALDMVIDNNLKMHPF